jgi:hypothetical protein
MIRWLINFTRDTHSGLLGFFDFVHGSVFERTQRFGNWICFRPRVRGMEETYPVGSIRKIWPQSLHRAMDKPQRTQQSRVRSLQQNIVLGDGHVILRGNRAWQKWTVYRHDISTDFSYWGYLSLNRSVHHTSPIRFRASHIKCTLS